MHTSKRLASADFEFLRCTGNQQVSIPFHEFCPDYHELDRIGVVSPTISHGVLNAGRTILALTTAFYDAQRAKANEFFDYPQHFAIVGADKIDPQVDEHHLWRAWSLLDVWPNNKWITAPPTAMGLLKAVFNYQINRLFWPRDLWPTLGEAPLPEYAYRMLGTRLKSVCLYGNVQGRQPYVKISGSLTAEELLTASIEQLPKLEHVTDRPCEGRADCVGEVSIEQFLQLMGM